MPDPYADITYGKELPDSSDVPHYVDDGSIPTAERLAISRRAWPEGRAQDFRRLNRRRWEDVATGTAYRRVTGVPWHDAVQQAVDTWFVDPARNELVYLILESRAETYGLRTVA